MTLLTTGPHEPIRRDPTSVLEQLDELTNGYSRVQIHRSARTRRLLEISSRRRRGRVYGRLGDRRAHATKMAQTIVSPTAAGNGTSDVGIDTSTASFVIDPSGNSGIREPFRLVHSMQTRSMPRGIV